MKTYRVTRKEIIMLGQSIGSGPTCFFASKRENADLGAVVLVSPLMSALNVVSVPDAWCTPAKVFKRYDVYKNYASVKNIACPILLIHGARDEVVHMSHGEALWETIQKSAAARNRSAASGRLSSKDLLQPYWIQGAGHDDTYDRNPAEYIRRLSEVCALVRERYKRIEQSIMKT
jgi:alpha-beta hydrolase superfamily lysophospholipase